MLIVMPNYDFRGIFGSKEYKIFRNHWVSNPDYLDDPGLDTTGGRILEEAGLHKTKWDDVKLDMNFSTIAHNDSVGIVFESVDDLITDLEQALG